MAKENMPSKEVTELAKAEASITKLRDKIYQKLIEFEKLEKALAELIRKEAKSSEIQITALVGVPSACTIKADTVDLHCILTGMAKGRIIQDEKGEYVLIIHRRIRAQEPEEKEKIGRI